MDTLTREFTMGAEWIACLINFLQCRYKREMQPKIGVRIQTLGFLLVAVCLVVMSWRESNS